MITLSLEQFRKKYNNTSVDFDKHFGAQCVDLFNFYNAEVVGAPFIGTPVTNGARDLAEVNSETRDRFYEKLDAAAEIKAGDVLVYGPPLGRAIENGVQVFYGHVSIAIDSSNVIEQNGKVAQKTVERPIFKTGLIGILRPKNITIQPSSPDVPRTLQNKNKHIIVAGDTFWGLENEKGWPHGLLQEINPGIDPKNLTIGSKINIPADGNAGTDPVETYYNIKPGDTFWDLENAWQIPHGKLQELNPNVDPRTLQIDQRIRRS